ncbi:MAG: hypothetical protein V8T47_07365 [Oscillospiraceae bacterium]
MKRLACGAGSKYEHRQHADEAPHAAHIATEAGVPMVIANGAQPAALYDLMESQARRREISGTGGEG